MKRVLASLVLGVALCVVGPSKIHAAANTHSLGFDGVSNQYGYTSGNTLLSNVSAMTLEMWAKTSSVVDSIPLKMWNYPTTVNYTFLLYFTESGSKPLLGLGSDGIGNQKQATTTSATINDGNWHHIAVVFNGTLTNDSRVVFYIDGSPVATTVDSSFVAATYNFTADGPIQIGRHGVGSLVYNGLMDEVRIWNTARSAAEIAANYSKQLVGDESGLLLYYQFNEGTGTNVDDVAYSGLDSTLVNTPAWSADVPFVGNAPPTAFSLTAPSTDTSTKNNKPTFSWGASIDPELAPVTYTLNLSVDSGFDPMYREVSGLNTTSYTPGTGDEIADNSYYWKVTASDGERETASTGIWQLTVDTQAPVVPIITFIGSNSQTGKISEIRGTGETGTTLTCYDKSGGAIQGTTGWAGGIFTFTPTTPFDSGSVVSVESTDAAANYSRSNTKAIIFETFDNISRDGDVYHGAVPGDSMRMAKNTSYEFDIAVNAGSPVTVRAWLRYNSAYDGSGADAPVITLSGLGITTGNTAAMTAPASYTPDTWEQLTVSGTPNATGVVTLKVETFSTVDGAKTWVDDIGVAQ